MSTAIESGFHDLSLHTEEGVMSNQKESTRSDPLCITPDEWVFGFHFKSSYFRRLAEKYGLDWENDTLGVICMFAITDRVRHTSEVPFKIRAVTYRGASTQVVTFLEDDSRRRMDRIKVTNEEMGKVREIIGIPKGCRPKWFDVYDLNHAPNAESSSDDEAPPGGKDTWMVSPYIEKWEDDPLFYSDSDSEVDENMKATKRGEAGERSRFMS